MGFQIAHGQAGRVPPYGLHVGDGYLQLWPLAGRAPEHLFHIVQADKSACGGHHAELRAELQHQRLQRGLCARWLGEDGVDQLVHLMDAAFGDADVNVTVDGLVVLHGGP